MMLQIHLPLVLCLASLHLKTLSCQETDDGLPMPDLAAVDEVDENPGTQFDIRVYIGPGKVECLYQKLKRDSILHVSFQVLRGADRNIDVVVKDPRGDAIESHLWTHEGASDKTIELEGDYAFCMDNSFSRFSSKLVYFYMAVYVPQDWEKYAKDIENFDVSVANVTASLKKVDSAVTLMKQLQAVSRRHAVVDWYLLDASNRNVQLCSFFSCIVIVTSLFVQLVFVKRLFGNSTGVSRRIKAGL